MSMLDKRLDSAAPPSGWQLYVQCLLFQCLRSLVAWQTVHPVSFQHIHCRLWQLRCFNSKYARLIQFLKQNVVQHSWWQWERSHCWLTQQLSRAETLPNCQSRIVGQWPRILCWNRKQGLASSWPVHAGLAEIYTSYKLKHSSMPFFLDTCTTLLSTITCMINV